MNSEARIKTYLDADKGSHPIYQQYRTASPMVGLFVLKPSRRKPCFSARISMKRMAVLGFCLIACATTRAFHPPGEEAPPCIYGAKVQVTVTPSRVQLGQPAYLSWHVSVPNRCGGLQVRLNNRDVAENGTQTITPSRPATFTVTVIHSYLGWSTSTSQSARVDVDYPARVVIDGSTPDPVQVLIGALVDSA